MSEGFVFGLEVVDLPAEDLELRLSLDTEAEGALSILKQSAKVERLYPYLRSFFKDFGTLLFLRPRLDLAMAGTREASEGSVVMQVNLQRE